MSETWLKVKKCEIPDNEIKDMQVGDYFIYTANIPQNGNTTIKQKYIFKLKHKLLSDNTLQFERPGEEGLWTVKDYQLKFANALYIEKQYGSNFLKDITLEKDYKDYKNKNTVIYEKGIDDLNSNIVTTDLEQVKKEQLRTYGGGLKLQSDLKSGAANTDIVYKYYSGTDPYMKINQEETKMSDKVKEVIEDNAEAAKVAAKIVAGRTLNEAVMDKVVPQLPMLVRGYAKTPIGAVVVANLVNFGVQNFMQDNEKAAWVADAMMVAAMTEALSSFNLEKILKEVIATAGIEVPAE